MLFLSCDDDTAPRSPNFVIEAFITANQTVDNIKVKGTSPIDSIKVTSEPIPNAVVTISNDENSFPLDFNELTGKYENRGEEIAVISGERYQLDVAAGGREATAETTVPDFPQGLRLSDSVLIVPELRLSLRLGDEIRDLFFNERILLRWDSVPGQKFFVVIESRVDEIDLILPDGIPAGATELLSSFRFISEPSDTPTFPIIGVALETYGKHIAKVFTINQEYVDLFENLEQDSRDLNEPPSNVQNAQGIFTAFASDSVFFEVRKR